MQALKLFCHRKLLPALVLSTIAKMENKSKGGGQSFNSTIKPMFLLPGHAQYIFIVPYFLFAFSHFLCETKYLGENCLLAITAEILQQQFNEFSFLLKVELSSYSQRINKTGLDLFRFCVRL